MTSWNLLPWQLRAPSNVVNTADSAVTTHASSSYYHLNINYNQNKEIVKLNFLPPHKVDKTKKKKKITYKYNIKSKNMYKPISPINDTSNKSIQVPSVIRKNNAKERKHRKKKESSRTAEQPLVVTDSANTNIVYESNKKNIVTGKSDKNKTHHRHKRERSRETLVTITDTVSIEHPKDQGKNRSKKHRNHSEPSQTATISEKISAEICKEKTIISKDVTKKHKERRECSEDSITITATFSKSITNVQIGKEITSDKKDSKGILINKKKLKKKQETTVVEAKQQQQLQNIIANFETVSGKNAQIYYIHSVGENDPEIAPVLRPENKEISTKHVHHKSKRKRKHHLSVETKCKDIHNTTSSSKSQESLPTENKKEGIKFFFIKNRNKSEVGQKRKTSPSKERKKSREVKLLKVKPSESVLIDDNSRKEALNEPLATSIKIIKQVNKDSIETLHCAGDVSFKLNKTCKTRCVSQDKSGSNKLDHGYSKQRSKSETNVKHKEIDVVGDQKPKSSRKTTKDNEKHHKRHHKVESTDVEAEKKNVKAEGVIEKIFFKKGLLKNKSKEHKTTKELESKGKTRENLTPIYSTDEKHQDSSKKRKRHKTSEERKSSDHKIIESTETGEVLTHKHHKKSEKHRRNEEITPKSSTDIPKKHVRVASTEDLHRKSRRKEKEKHIHTKHAENTSKSTVQTEQERTASITDNSEATCQLTTEINMENKVIKGETKKIIKISKQQLEAILNQINKKQNLQQSKTLHYKLPSNEEKTSETIKQTRKEVSFSHLNLKPVVAYYASPTPKQFDCTSTYNSILSFPIKDKRPAKPKRKTKIPDQKSVVSEAITKKEKFQYVNGRRYSTNRAVRNFAYSENIFERSRKALRENDSSTVGFTVEGVEPPKKLKPDIIPSCLLKPFGKDLTVAIVTGIDIQPKYQRGMSYNEPKEIFRSLSLLNTAADGDFTDGRGLSDASEKPQYSYGVPNAKTFTSLLTESRHSSSSPLGSRKPTTENIHFNMHARESQDLDTNKYCMEGIHKFFEEDELDKDQFAALGQEVFTRMMLYMKERFQSSKENNEQIRDNKNPVRKDSSNVRPLSRGSSVSSRRSIASSKDTSRNVITKSNFSFTKNKEIDKATCSKNSVSKEKDKNNLGATSRNSSINSGVSPKRHLNIPIRDRSKTSELSPKNNLPEKKDIEKVSKVMPPPRKISVRSASPRRQTTSIIDDASNRKRPSSVGTHLPESKVPVATHKSRETSNESASAKFVTSKHISLYDRSRMMARRRNSRSPSERKTLEATENEKLTKIPMRIRTKSLDKETSLDRSENCSRRMSSDRKSRTRSSGSTSSEVSTINNRQKRSSSLESTKNIKTIKKPKPARNLQNSETFLCDSLNQKLRKLTTTVADVTNVGGIKPGEGIKPLAKITEETSSQNLLDNKYSQLLEKLSKDSWSSKQDSKEKEDVVENKIDEHLKNVSNEIFDSVLKILNSESTIKRRFLYDVSTPTCSSQEAEPQKSNVPNIKPYHEDKAPRKIEAAEKDQPHKPKDTHDRPPEIKCSSCSTNVQRNLVDSDAESGVSKYSDKEKGLKLEDKVRVECIDDLNKTAKFFGNSMGKSKIPLKKDDDFGQIRAEEAIKQREKRARSIKRREELGGRKHDVVDEEKAQDIKREAHGGIGYEPTKQKLASDMVNGSGEQLDGKEIQRLSNLVKHNVIKELGAANLLKPHILEDKTKKGQQLDDIIERSIASALNQRVYSVMHSIAMNDGAFQSEDMHASGTGKNDQSSSQELKNNQQTIEEHKNNVPKGNNKQNSKIKGSQMVVKNQQSVEQKPEDKKATMLKKLTAMLVSEPDFRNIECRLDNILGIPNSQVVNMASVPSKSAFNYKKSNQIAYTVPNKRCKIRKSRIKITPPNETNTKKQNTNIKTNISKTRIFKEPKIEQISNSGGFKENQSRNNIRPQNISKIPTLIKPPPIPKLIISDTSESYNSSNTKRITSTDKSLNSVTENPEQPNSARYLTKLLDIELVDHQENSSCSKFLNTSAKARTTSSINTKSSRPLSAYEKRKLYGEQLRLKRINSKNEPPLTISSNEPEKGTNKDCIYCYPQGVRNILTDSELQKNPRKETSPKFASRPEVQLSPSDYNSRSRDMMETHQESEIDIPTLGCYLCTKLHCNNRDPKMLPSNSNKGYKYSNGNSRKPPRDENIYHAYSVLTNYPNVTDVFKNKFKSGSSISLFSRESMFSCDNISPCISPRSVASNCSLNTINSRTLSSTKSSSLLNAKYSNEETKRMAKGLRKKKYLGTFNSVRAFGSPSKEFFSTIEQKDSFNNRKDVSGSSQLNITPSYEFCHSTPEYLPNLKSAEVNKPFFTKSACIPRQKGNLLETCQQLRNNKHRLEKNIEDDSNTSNSLKGNETDGDGYGYYKPLGKNNYKNVNRKTFFRDTKSLIYQSLERTSKALDGSKSTRLPYSNLHNQEFRESDEKSDSEGDLTDPYMEVSSVDVFEERERAHNNGNKNKARKGYGRVPKYPGQNSNLRLHSSRDLKNKSSSKRRRSDRYKIIRDKDDEEQEPVRYRNQNQPGSSNIEYNPSSTKDEDGSYTIFKLDNDFQIHRKRKKHLEKNQSEECFKIFAYNNIIELDMDFPAIYCENNAQAYKPFLFNNLGKSDQYKMEQLSFSSTTPDSHSEQTESGYGSSKSRQSRKSLRKFFPQQQTVLDTFTSTFKCFDQEVYVSQTNPLSRVTTFPVNTGEYSKKGKPDDHKRQKQRKTLFEDSTPTSDCSDFSNEPYRFNQPSSSKFKNSKHDRPISHLYNIDLDHKKRDQNTSEYDQRVNFKIDMEEAYSSSNDHKPHKYYEEHKESNKRDGSKIPQKLRHHRVEEVEEQVPFVCQKHKPFLCLKHKLLSTSYMKKEYHQDADEEPCSSKHRAHRSENPKLPHRHHKYTEAEDYKNSEYVVPLQRQLSNVWQLDGTESDEEAREMLDKPDDTWRPDYKEVLHRSGGRFKEIMRSISRPFSKKSSEGGLDDQCSAYTSSTKDSEPTQKYYWFKNAKNRNMASKSSGISLRDVGVGESEIRCSKTKNYKNLQKQVDQCHEYANKVCTESRLRQEGHLKQFVDFKEIPLSILLGKKKSEATESIKTNSSKGCHRSRNAPPKLKVLDDAQCSKEVHTLKSLRENQEKNFKNVYYHDESVPNPFNKRGVYNKETCKALKDLLEHTECTKKACESLRNCLRNSDCSKETYDDLKNALKESDCSEETCKNLRTLLKELRETFLEGTEGTSVNLKNVSKESLIPLKELLDMGFQKLLDLPPDDEPSTELMRIPSEITLSRCSSQHTITELLDLPYEDSTITEDSIVPLRELLDRVFDELLSSASKNSRVSSEISTHFIKSPSNERTPSDCTVFTDLPLIKLARSPGKTSLNRPPRLESAESTNQNKRRLSIESSDASLKEMQTQPTVLQVDQLLKELSQKTADNLFESFKERLDSPKTSLKGSLATLYPTDKQSTSFLGNLSKESKELLQITIQKVLSHSKEMEPKEPPRHSEPLQFSSSRDRRSAPEESTTTSKDLRCLSKDSKDILEEIFQKLLTLAKEPVGTSLKQFIPLPSAELTLVNPEKHFLTEFSLSEYSGTSSDLKPFSSSIPYKEEIPPKPSDESFYTEGKEEQDREPNSGTLGDIAIPTEILIKELLQYYVEVPETQPFLNEGEASNIESPKEIIEKEASIKKSLEQLCQRSPKGSLLCACKYLRSVLKEPLKEASKEAIMQILKSLAEDLSNESKADLYRKIQILFKGTELEQEKSPTDLSLKEPIAENPLNLVKNSEEPLDLSIRETSIQISQSPVSVAPEPFECTKATCPKRKEIPQKASVQSQSDASLKEAFEESLPCSSKIMDEIVKKPSPPLGCTKSSCKSFAKLPEKYSSQILPENSKEALEEVFQKLINLSQEAVSSKEILEGVLNTSDEIQASREVLPKPDEAPISGCTRISCKHLKSSSEQSGKKVVNLDSHPSMEEFIEASSSSAFAECTKMSCKSLNKSSEQPVEQPPKEASVENIKSDSYTSVKATPEDFVEESVEPEIKSESYTSIKDSPPDFVQAPSDPKFSGCSQKTCKNLQRPSTKSVGTAAQEVSKKDFNSETQKPEELVSECTKATCKSLKKESVAVVPPKNIPNPVSNKSPDENVLEEPLKPETPTTKPLHCSKSTCTSLNYIAAKNPPTKEASVQITRSNSIPPNRSLSNQSKELLEEMFKKLSAEPSKETLEETVAKLISLSKEIVPQEEVPVVPSECTNETCIFRPKTVEESKELQEELPKKKSPCKCIEIVPKTSNGSLPKELEEIPEFNEESKEISEEVPPIEALPRKESKSLSKTSNEPPPKEEIEEENVELQQILEEVPPIEEIPRKESETLSKRSNEPPPKEEIEGSAEGNEESKVTLEEVPPVKELTKKESEIISKPSVELPALKEEISDTPLKKSSEPLAVPSAKEEISECSHSTCQFLKELSKESRELLENTLQNIISASKKSLSVVSEEPPKAAEVEAVPETPSQVTSESKPKEVSPKQVSPKCTCSDLMVAKTLSKNSLQRTREELNQTASIKSDDLSLLIEEMLEPVEKERKSDENLLENSDNIPKQEEPKEPPQLIDDNPATEPPCECPDLISFAEESRELLDIPLQNTPSEPVPEVLLPIAEPLPQKEGKSILDEPLPECQCENFATSSQESIELSNTIFQNLTKSSEQCMIVQINEKPHIIESFSGTSKDQDKDSILFSKKSFENLTGFPQKTELLFALHNILSKNPMEGMLSKKGSEKLKKLTSSHGKIHDKKVKVSPDPAISSEVPEELLKQLCNVSLKTMMELYDKVADNKEMKMSFKTMVEELCRNKIKEEKLSGTATQSQLNIIQLLKQYTRPDEPDEVQAQGCPCLPSMEKAIERKDAKKDTTPAASPKKPEKKLFPRSKKKDDIPKKEKEEKVMEQEAGVSHTPKDGSARPPSLEKIIIESKASKDSKKDTISESSQKKSSSRSKKKNGSSDNKSKEQESGVPQIPKDGSARPPSMEKIIIESKASKDSKKDTISESSQKKSSSRSKKKDKSSTNKPKEEDVMEEDAGISLKSEKGVTDLSSISSKADKSSINKNPLKELRESLTDKELFEKLLDSYEKEENIVERLSNDEEFFQTQLDSVQSKESITTLMAVKEKITKKTEEQLLAALDLDSLSQISDHREKRKHSISPAASKPTQSTRRNSSKSKMGGFTSKVARLFKSDQVKEIVAPRPDNHKYSVDMSYLGKKSYTENDEEVELIHKSLSHDDNDENHQVKFIGGKRFEEEKKLLHDDSKSFLTDDLKKAINRKSSIDSNSNVVKPSELGKCFLRGFRSDYVSLAGDTCLLISNQEKEKQGLSHESYIEFSERDTPLEYLLALGFSIDEASNAIKDEDVKNRLFAAITEARIWINQISTVQGTLLYLIAYKAKPRIMRYYLQLVEAIINRRIQNAVKLDAFLRVLEKVEDGDLTLNTIIGSEKLDDEENEEKMVKKQLRQLFINVYTIAEHEADLKHKPLSKEGIVLLRILAAKYRAGLHPHLELIARYIGQDLLQNEVQLEAAMIYLSRLDTADVDLNEFEQYCGIVCKENKAPASSSKE